MIITVASGKGGTGKTTVAVSLALSLASWEDVPAPVLLDCDVEAPNAALFLNPVMRERREVGQMIPQVDPEACTLCGRCADVCQFNAIAVVGESVLVFSELCHACGSCALNCPADAIDEVLDVMGVLERGSSDGFEFAHGILNVGEMMAVPVIHQLKQLAIPPQVGGRPCDETPVILDAPPGNACPVVEAMEGADFVLLVTEPTPFGLHDLRQAVEVARDEMGLPVGVVINREGVGDQGVDAYCEAEGIPVLMRIPIDRRIAEAYSEGVSLVEALPRYRERFRELYRDVEALVGCKGELNP
jgi:MinD superfamily P-loop ATPase